MSGCTSLHGRLTAQMHSGRWESPRYKRLKPNLLGALEGEVIEIGPGSGVNLKYYRDYVHWTGVEPNTFLHERIRRRALRLGLLPGRWPGAQNASTHPMRVLTRWRVSGSRTSCRPRVGSSRGDIGRYIAVHDGLINAHEIAATPAFWLSYALSVA